MDPKRDENASRGIEILREDVSAKIAAGEVIDRPFSVVRELVDNAVDAAADSIEVHIEGGGIARITVLDNGSGMSRRDLELCCQRHATSKIREEGDLYRVRSLGFRGEALASVAACSRLEIVSRERAGRGEAAVACRLRVEGGKGLELEQRQGNPGTAVTVSDLFFNLPVRRKFLKSTAAESGMCRQIFLEKALPHPEIAFRFFSDGKLRSHLQPAGLTRRVAEAFVLQPEHLTLLEAGQPDVRLRLVAARPELTRRDRRLLQIYVNRRRISEYSLVHAVEHAYRRYMPGAQHPVAFVFLELDPRLADFNIHPAKREARFRDLPALHHLVSATLAEYLQEFDLQARPPRPQETAGPAEGALAFPEAQARSRSPRALEDGPLTSVRVSHLPTEPQPPGDVAQKPLYRGQLFNLFLLVEYGDSLYVVDQHAAHERILFEQLKSSKANAQELLLPIRLEVGEDGARALSERRELFQRLGIRLEKSEDGTWEITALPEALIAIEEQALVQALLLEKGSVDELADRVYSLAACRLAIKEGRELDALTATELIRRVFQLTNARCPHGRPIWFQVTEEQLLREVGRT